MLQNSDKIQSKILKKRNKFIHILNFTLYLRKHVLPVEMSKKQEAFVFKKMFHSLSRHVPVYVKC